MSTLPESKPWNGVGFTGADLITRRTALGLFNTTALHNLIGYQVATIDRWEHDRLLGDEFDGAMLRVVRRLEVYAGELTDALLEQSRASGQIVTYRNDDEAAEAGAMIPVGRFRDDVHNRLSPAAQGVVKEVAVAAFHRVCAGRAAIANPEAEVVIAGLQENGFVSVAERSEVLVQLTMLGISTTTVERAIGVPQRVLQNWILGKVKNDRPVATIGEDQLGRVSALADAADAHADVLEAGLQRRGDSIIPVASTIEDLQQIDPGTILSLDTHRAVVGELLAGDFDLRGSWLSPRSLPKHMLSRADA